MDTFSVRDLRERTGQLIRDAEQGKLSLVTKRGKPVFVAVPFDETLLTHGLSLAFGIEVYKQGVVSLEKAAKIAGVSLESFMETLSQLNIDVVDYDPAEVSQELKNIKKYKKK